jgi:hypothetical protein
VKLNPEKNEVINVSKALQTHPKKYVLGDQEINRFSRTTGDIPDLACSPGPSKAYIARLPILNFSSIFIFPFSW